MYLLIALLGAWLFCREFQRPTPFDEPRGAFEYGYLAVTAAVCWGGAMAAYDHVRFEQILSEHAREVSGHPNADVYCQSLADTMVDTLPMSVAHANPESGQIEFKATWCGHMRDYIDDPEKASGEVLWALHVFTHEVMHIRGERNEKTTDCQAYQRNFMMSERLGVPADIAQRHAAEIYANRSRHRDYFSQECRRGGRLDEGLPFPPWPRS